MPDFQRYALYTLAEDADLAAFGASWLGWDIVAGKHRDQPAIAGIEDATATPRKYGFHGTLKPPFRLAANATLDALQREVAHFARATKVITLDGLSLAKIGRFLALVSFGDTSTLDRFAFACVTRFDAFRAPPTEAELLRRRAAGLTPRQKENLTRWGYPCVNLDFRFHMTLSGKLDPQTLTYLQVEAEARLPTLRAPFTIASVALVGEAADGMFRLIERYSLTE